MELAPIIVFAYNRPEHLKRTLDALARNALAKESILYIYCDGPKDVRNKGANELMDERASKNRSLVNEVQAFAKQYAIDAPKQGLFKTIQIVCSDKNNGLANSIICGVTEVVNKYGRVIVLEDDLLTSPYFLKYMNGGLEFYQYRPSVYSISGYNYSPQKMIIPQDYEYDTYVSLRFCSWGWAMWKDRWNQVDWRTEFYEEIFRHPYQIKAFNRGGDDLVGMLHLQRVNKIDSWAIRCAYNQFVNHGVTIYPCISYVENIGLDGSGVHCGDVQNADTCNKIENAKENPHYVNILYEDSRIINAFYNVYNRSKRTLWQRIINTIYRKFGKQAPFFIKKKVYC